jgi:hypothetical protein
MESSIDDPEAFQYELSAFLSAARSVLQYALEEAKQKPNGQRWYEAQVSGNAVLKFFKDKRDLNIHAESVRPSRHIAVAITEHITFSESIRIANVLFGSIPASSFEYKKCKRCIAKEAGPK